MISHLCEKSTPGSLTRLADQLRRVFVEANRRSLVLFFGADSRRRMVGAAFFAQASAATSVAWPAGVGIAELWADYQPE